MNSSLDGKFKPMLPCLVAMALVTPSVIWIALDRSVWPWDQAFYAKGSVELFSTLIHSPKRWIFKLNMPQGQPPGVSWLGQFFVPLEYLIGSIDAALLVSILITQALTLVLTYYYIRRLSALNALIANASCLVIASAPLFVGMSHQYLTEPLQLLAVTWFVLIMSFAPQWSRPLILSQLLAATSTAILAKASSPLYCVGPGLAALWHVFKPGPTSFVKREWLQKRVLVVAAGGILLNLAAIVWYYKNINAVIHRIYEASFGPNAEIYGKRDSFLNTMTYWLQALRNSFFLPSVFVLISLLFGLGIALYFIKAKTRSSHFALCSLIAILQITIVLVVFSFSPSREVRYLLPLLPYLALAICWSLAQINSRILTVLTILLFLTQFANTYGEALGIKSLRPTATWLMPPNRSQMEHAALNSIVLRTCTQTDSGPYWNIIGIEKPWLNEHSANYVAAKILTRRGRRGCHYASGFDSFDADSDKIWRNISAMKIHYYVTANPDLNPVPSSDAHLQAINRNYIPMLQKVQSSELFELEPPLPEDPAILIFRRKEIDQN